MKSAGLPNIKGGSSYIYLKQGSGSSTILTDGAITSSPVKTTNWASGGSKTYENTKFGFDASKYNSIYGSSSTVQPNSYTVLYIMKIKA